ncbi:hypothetical protein L1887_29850 [Cichorium endivia]|nr:hypothetical protein L1887_29850 [Cichorium endivia]
MELEDNNLRPVKEDTLSSLPDDVIHKTLSCIDMKFDVHTCISSYPDLLSQNLIGPAGLLAGSCMYASTRTPYQLQMPPL